MQQQQPLKILTKKLQVNLMLKSFDVMPLMMLLQYWGFLSSFVASIDDNEGDSEMIGDGFNDYYGAYGIDKAQVIKEERKLW